MSWVTLTLRKLTLRAEINSLELRDIQMSRQIRSIQRNLSYEQSIYNNSKQHELNAAKSAYLEIRDDRPETDSDEYADWQLDYSAAREDYEAQKQDINDYYDEIAFLNCPLDSINLLKDEKYLNLLRSKKIIVVVSSGAYEEESLKETYELEEAMKNKAIPACFYYWTNNYPHNFSSWKIYLSFYIKEFLN